MTTQKQLKDFSGAGKLAAEYFNSLKQMQDDFIQSRQDLLSGFSVSDSLNSGFASDSSTTLNRSASIDTDTMNAAAQKILDAKAARAAKASRQSSGSDLSKDTALAWMNDAQSALKNAQLELRTARGSAEDTASAQQAYDTAKQNYDTARSVYASFAAQGNANEVAESDSPHVTIRPLSDIEADLNAAGSYIEDLDQWVAKPGQQETLNNLLYEQRQAWAQQARDDAANKAYTKGDQIEAATAASVGEGLDNWSTDTQVMVYKLFGLDVPDYLLVESPLAIQNEKTLENASGALKTISGVSKIAGYAIPGMVTDMLLPAGAVSELGKVSKILYTAVRNVPNANAAGGSAYKQAKTEGKSDEQASAYSLLNGAANLAFGTLFEGFGNKMFANGAAKESAKTGVIDTIKTAVSKVIKNPDTVKTLASLSNNMGMAAAQTYLQEAIDPILRNASLGEANTIADLWKHATSAETITNVLQSATMA